MAVQRDKVIASAEKLVAKGKIEPAIKEYERLLEDNPNDVNTLNRIGDLWVRINRNDEAVKVFGKIADHYSKDGFFLKAIAIYKKINKLDPSKLDIYAKLADLNAKQGLAMEAKSQYQVLADYYLKHGDPGNALLIYKKISELDPNSINVHVKLADLHSQVNNTAEALKEYDRVGRMLLKRGMLDEAVQVFRKALKIDAKNTELVDSLVTALLEAKDFENAKQIVEAALETNRDSSKLMAMMGRIQLGRGDMGGARATLERAAAADQNEPSVRETLADLYLKQNDANRALDMLAPLAERALARGERHAAIEMLNRILRVDSGHTPTLERLLAVYTRLNEETNVLASMNSLAEAHVARGSFDEAAKVLEKLIAKEPQNAQHRTKLQFVRSQMGGVDTLPPRPVTPPPMPAVRMPSLEIDEPAPTFDGPSFDGPSFDVGGLSEPELSLDLDESPPMELDFEIDAPAPAPPPQPAPRSAAPRPVAPPPPPQRVQPAVEVASADVVESNDDLDFITEHLTEAEVFAKYGLAEKAAEHLRAVLERAPKNLTAHERLFRILLEEGEIDGARVAAQAYTNLLVERGEAATINAVKTEFLTRGHTFEPEPARTPTRPTPVAVPPAPEPEPQFDLGETSEELTFDLDAPVPELEFDIEEPEEVALAIPEPEPEPEPVSDFAFDEEFDISPEPVVDEIPMAEAPMLEAVEEELTIEESAPELVIDESTAPIRAFDGTLPELEPEPEPEPEPVDESPFFGDGGFDLEELPLEEIGEIDFYIEQELFDEARRKLDNLDARFPGNADLSTRRERVESAATAAAAAAAAAAVAPRPPVLSRDEIESELLSAIPDEDDEVMFTPPPTPPPVILPTPEPMMSAALVEEDNLFADEDNFFDLAAELESELADEEEVVSLSEEEQSLEEIFKEFKKGVEQQLDSEDYDTHYNLGIAYKEMGLIDEAIGEFQLASKDPKRAVECASMLGLCFLEKGMPQLAIKWYRKGLEMPEITEEEHIGLLYDLASAYQEVGDTENAQKAFMEVYGMNSNYRDTVNRIKALEDSTR
ncbi:MAG TPA: tetratricopeptide repeat protein [Thermoanaerobaculia bacterium]|nr:tetratricopeptide repeat protein [Thermoanaerobaculia bacterium]